MRLLTRADGYFVQFAIQTDRVIEHVPTGTQACIEVGLRAYYTDSQGNTVANPRHSRTAQKRLKRLQRRLCRTHKKCKNRQKARQRAAKAYLKVQRQREDFARKTANALVTSHDLVAYEHLQIRNILRNRKIAKSIYDAGWGVTTTPRSTSWPKP